MLRFEEFLERVRAKTPGAFFLVGDEPFFLNEAVREAGAVLALGTARETVVESVDGRGLKASDLISLASSAGFFGSMTAVVVRRAWEMDSSQQTKLMERLVKKDVPNLLLMDFTYASEKEKKTARESPIYSALIRKRHTDSLSKEFFEKYGERVVACYKLKPWALEGWIKSKVKARRKAITREAINLLIERTGGDLFFLANELEKLLAFTAGKDIISLEDVAYVVASAPHGFSDLEVAFATRDRKKAVEALRDLVASGMKSLVIVERLLNFVRQLYPVVACYRAGYRSVEEISNVTGLAPFVVERMLKFEEYQDEKTLLKVWKVAMEVDELAKKYGEREAIWHLERFLMGI